MSHRVVWVIGSIVVSMLWLALGVFGSLTLVGAVAVKAKQALFEDAQAATEGYF